MPHTHIAEAVESVSSPPTMNDATPVDETLTCEVCDGPMMPGRAGSKRRFCSSACRLKAHRGGTPSRSAPEAPRGRDDAVHQLCLVILREDGLRNGLDALSRVFADEDLRIAALPWFTRHELAARIVASLGFQLKEAAP
jgi:hypothetical protein